MIDISKPLTSGKVQSYYRSEYSSASNSYFSQGGTLLGDWHGQLAGTLGLSGAVTPEAFDRLAEGMHPLTGEQLIQHRDTIKTQAGEELGHRAGWDLTFNAPKTVSLTALVGEDNRVRHAHQEAVRIALAETEKYVQARLGGNLPAENTSKWIAATFEHDTARPVNGYPAPHLHTHVVVFNLTEDAHGQARSLQPYELFKVQSMSTAVYQNALEHELRQLGYRIDRGKNHAPEINGYTREYLAAESLRAAEIERAMAERGLTGREAESIVKHQNRDEKLRLTSEELRALHREKAAAFGRQPQALVEEASHRKDWRPDVDQTLGKAAAAIAFARERLSERTAVFEHFEVIRDALRQVQGRVPLPPIQAELDRQLAVGQFVKVDHIRPNAPAARYSTPQLLEVEREAIERMRVGLAQMHPIAFVRGAEMDQRFSHLNDDQRRLVGDALASRDQIFGIQGGAGTGKTTALTAIREIAEENGYRTLGLGPTSRAAKGLREARIDAETMQAFLLRERPAGDDPRDRLFFVDETSLASGRQLRDFLERLQPSDRVLLVGDTRQHQSVEAGRIFAELQDAGMRMATLSQIVRQKDEGLRQVVEAMAGGRIGDGINLLSQQNRVHGVAASRRTFCRHCPGLRGCAAERTLVISPDNGIPPRS